LKNGIRSWDGEPAAAYDCIMIDEEFRRWEAQSACALKSLMASLMFADDSIEYGPAALLSASDQLQATLSDISLLMETADDCPLPDIGQQFSRLMRSYAAFAELLGSEATSTKPPDKMLLHREAIGLVDMFTQLLAMMSDRFDAGSQ
jgi:hypothetical protein